MRRKAFSSDGLSTGYLGLCEGWRLFENTDLFLCQSLLLPLELFL